MTYQPVVAGSGLAAFAFLKQTFETQSQAFNAGPQISRDTAYFQEKIGDIDTAEDLVSDRRLLRVALGAYGLQDDINNRYFIRRILDDGTIEPDALANRLADDRYKEFSKAFGFGDFSTPNTKLSDFGDKIVARYRRQQFEVAVGTQNDSMRLALNAERALGELAQSSSTETTKWFKVMGNPPLREVFETALSLPSSFGQLDIDKQLEVFRDRAESQLGSADISDFADPDQQKKLVDRFLLKVQVNEFQASSSGSIAVSLLQSAADFARSRSLI